MVRRTRPNQGGRIAVSCVQKNPGRYTNAAARPNAHAQILALAAYCLALAGRLDEGRAHLARIHQTLPDYRVDDLLAAFHLGPDDERLFRDAAKRIGAE
jgi:hypothetical protein